MGKTVVFETEEQEVVKVHDYFFEVHAKDTDDIIGEFESEDEAIK